MPERSARRRRHKQLARLQNLPPARRQAEAALRLVGWRREARRRAGSLPAPPAWALARDPTVCATAVALDPGGELLDDLRRVCAEAVAGEAGPSLVRGSRPVADRARLQPPRPSAPG